MVGGIIGLGTGSGFAIYTSPTGAVDFATVTGAAAPFTVAPYGNYVSGLPASGAVAASTYALESGSVTTTAPETVNDLKILGSASPTTLTLGGALTLGTAGQVAGLLFDNSGGSAVIAAGASETYTLGGAGSEIVVYTGGSGDNSANTLTIGAPISSGAGALTKAGPGALIISGSNYFTGNVTIDQGTLQLSGTNASLGAITTAANTTTVRQGATLDINAAGPGNTITIGALTGAGTITNSGGGTGAPATLNIGYFGVTTGSQTFSGLLTDGAGVLNVTKNGSGTEFLNPLNGAFQSTGSSAGSTALTGTVNSTTRHRAEQHQRPLCRGSGYGSQHRAWNDDHLDQ